MHSPPPDHMEIRPIHAPMSVVCSRLPMVRPHRRSARARHRGTFPESDSTPPLPGPGSVSPHGLRGCPQWLFHHVQHKITFLPNPCRPCPTSTSSPPPPRKGRIFRFIWLGVTGGGKVRSESLIQSPYFFPRCFAPSGPIPPPRPRTSFHAHRRPRLMRIWLCGGVRLHARAMPPQARRCPQSLGPSSASSPARAPGGPSAPSPSRPGGR